MATVVIYVPNKHSKIILLKLINNYSKNKMNIMKSLKIKHFN